MTGNELFDEISHYQTDDLSIQQKYIRLYTLLDRVCKLLTNEGTADFSNLFSRLHYLCEQKNIPSKAIEIFRIHGKHAQQYSSCSFTEDDYRYDLKALCEFISRISDTPVPDALREAIVYFLKHVDEAERCGLRAQRRVKENYSIEQVCKCLGNLWKEVE